MANMTTLETIQRAIDELSERLEDERREPETDDVPNDLMAISPKAEYEILIALLESSIATLKGLQRFYVI